MKTQWSQKRFVLIVGLALVLVVAGASWVLAQTEGEIYACVNPRDGTLRIVADENQCKKNETLLTWNITGPQGEPGTPGTNGTNGADGAAGADGLACWDGDGDGLQDDAEDINDDGKWDAADCQGPQGSGGPASLAALQGTACTVGGHPGTVNVAVADDGAITLTCVPVPVRLTVTEDWRAGPLYPTIGWGVSSGQVIDYSGWTYGSGWYWSSALPQTARLSPGAVIDLIASVSGAPQFVLKCPDGDHLATSANGSSDWVAECTVTMDGDVTVTVGPPPILTVETLVSERTDVVLSIDSGSALYVFGWEAGSGGYSAMYFPNWAYLTPGAGISLHARNSSTQFLLICPDGVHTADYDTESAAYLASCSITMDDHETVTISTPPVELTVESSGSGTPTVEWTIEHGVVIDASGWDYEESSRMYSSSSFPNTATLSTGAGIDLLVHKSTQFGLLCPDGEYRVAEYPADDGRYYLGCDITMDGDGTVTIFGP